MLKVNNLMVQYDKTVINKCDLEFKTGHLTAIVGPSGSGKTSILKKLALEQEDNNLIYETDYNVSKEEMRRKHIVYLPQENNFIKELSCYQHYELIKEMSSSDISFEEVLEMVELNIDRDIYPYNLSGGERQKFSLALGLVKGANIFICDEITASLDDKNARVIINILKKLAHSEHLTIIVSSHYAQLIEASDVVYEIKNKDVIKTKDYETVYSLPKTNINEFKLLKKSFLRKMYIKQLKKQGWMFTSYIILISFIVAICGIGCFAGFQFSNQFKQTLDIIDQNQSYVYKKAFEDRYDYNLSAKLTEDEKEEINRLSHNELKPFYSFWCLQGYCLVNNPEEVIYTNNWDFKVNGVNKETEVLNNAFYPYYPNQNLDYSCTYLDKDVEGMYIFTNLAKQLGIENLDSKVTLEFDVLVPVCYELDEMNFRKPIYSTRTIKMPVRGILHPSYSVYFNSTAFLPSNVMDQILNEETMKYADITGYVPYYDNLYVMFTDSSISLEQLQVELLNINPKLTFDNLGLHLAQSYKPFFQNENYIRVYISAVFIVSFIISVIYSFINFKSLKTKCNVLKRYGFTQLEVKRTLNQEILINTVLIFTVSMIVYIIGMLSLSQMRILFINDRGKNLIVLGILVILISSIVNSVLCYSKTILGGDKK